MKKILLLLIIIIFNFLSSNLVNVLFYIFLILTIFFNKRIILKKSLLLLICVVFFSILSSISQQNNFNVSDFSRDLYYFITPICIIFLGLNLNCKKNLNLVKLINFIINFVVVSLIIDFFRIAMNLKNILLNFDYVNIRESIYTNSDLMVFSFVIFLTYKLDIKYKKIYFTVLVFGLILSFSRTAYISFILMIVLSYFFYGKKLISRKNLSKILLISFLLIALLFFINKINLKLFGDFTSKFTNTLSEISTKIDWNNSYNIVHNWRGYEKYSFDQLFFNSSLFEKLFGYGFGKRLPIGFSELVGVDSNLGGIPIIHDGYRYILLKSGIIGLISYLSFFVLIIFTNLKNKKLKNRVLFLISLEILVVTYVTTGIFKPQFSQLLLLTFGYTLGNKSKEN